MVFVAIFFFYIILGYLFLHNFQIYEKVQFITGKVIKATYLFVCFPIFILVWASVKLQNALV